MSSTRVKKWKHTSYQNLAKNPITVRNIDQELWTPFVLSRVLKTSLVKGVFCRGQADCATLQSSQPQYGVCKYPRSEQEYPLWCAEESAEV